MMLRLLRKLLSVEILGMALVLASLQMLTYGISSSLPGADTGHLFVICILAAAFGWLFSYSKINAFQALLLIAALGMAGIWIVGARLSLPLWEWIHSIAVLFPQIIPAIGEKIPMDLTQVRETWAVVARSSSDLSLRWAFWLRDLGREAAVSDALVRTMIWSLVMWCCAAWIGWFAARRNAILALLPGIVLMALILSYSEYRIYSLWLMVILLLLLMGAWNYRDHTMQWERRRVDYSDSILYDNAQAVIFLALLVGAVSFTVPSISWRAIRDAIQNRSRSEAAEVLGIRRQTITSKNVELQKPSLPREHLLTEGFAQSQELVMTIRTGELPPIPSFARRVEAPRHYWRGAIYDQYQGSGWVTTATSPQKYRANSPLVPGLLEHYSPLHLSVDIQRPEGKLFWSGILYRTSVPFRADWRIRPQADLFAGQTALLQADMFSAASGAASYEADVYLPDVTIQQLRDASTSYPASIRTRYLQLPGDLPPRLRQLAAQITGGLENPYDKARAIEKYLRENYPYDLEIPAPPTDQDVADYFLFDLRRGYCDYYATAMVVLARASGLPARFVSGYASGAYDGYNAEYIVRELNAHSWAEIYFSEIGWIEFEPTASQPEIIRPEKEAAVAAVHPADAEVKKVLFRLTNTAVLYWVSAVLLVFLMAFLYFAVLERVWILNRSPASAVAILYRNYYKLGRPLAGTWTHAETAAEFTARLIHNVEEMDARAGRANPSKSIKENAQRLTAIYLHSLFSRRVAGKKDAGQAFLLWRRLRLQLLMARLRTYLHRYLTKVKSP